VVSAGVTPSGDAPSESHDVSPGPDGTFLTCPHCAESIRAEAKICRYCNRSVEPMADRLRNTANRLSNTGILGSPEAGSSADVRSKLYNLAVHRVRQVPKTWLVAVVLLAFLVFGIGVAVQALDGNGDGDGDGSEVAQDSGPSNPLYASCLADASTATERLLVNDIQGATDVRGSRTAVIEVAMYASQTFNIGRSQDGVDAATDYAVNAIRVGCAQLLATVER
jgi:hypothetical protein